MIHSKYCIISYNGEAQFSALELINNNQVGKKEFHPALLGEEIKSQRGQATWSMSVCLENVENLHSAFLPISK